MNKFILGFHKESVEQNSLLSQILRISQGLGGFWKVNFGIQNSPASYFLASRERCTHRICLSLRAKHKNSSPDCLCPHWPWLRHESWHCRIVIHNCGGHVQTRGTEAIYIRSCVASDSLSALQIHKSIVFWNTCWRPVCVYMCVYAGVTQWPGRWAVARLDCRPAGRSVLLPVRAAAGCSVGGESSACFCTCARHYCLSLRKKVLLKLKKFKGFVSVASLHSSERVQSTPNGFINNSTAISEGSNSVNKVERSCKKTHSQYYPSLKL